MEEEKKEKKGCSTMLVLMILLLFLVPLWGITGIMKGGFIEDLEKSMAALLFLGAFCAIGYAIVKNFNK